MTASHSPRVSTQSPQTKEGIVNCRPMSHQNSGDHGHEMHPQQFVRLVGCHHVHASPQREPEKVKLH
jgi:hypothetical protein